MEMKQVKSTKKLRKQINLRIDVELIKFVEANKLSPTLIFVTAVKELMTKQKKED
jgi:hypothetical protein